MPTDHSDKKPVQAPALKTPKEGEAPDAPVTVDPEVNYDPHRGSGGAYVIDEDGVRVPEEPPEPEPDPDAPVLDNTLPTPEPARNTAPLNE